MGWKRPKKIVSPEQAAENVARAHKRLNNEFKSEMLPGGKDVHAGNMIKGVMKKLDLTTPTLAGLLGIAQQNTSAMYRKKYLHASALVKVSEALQHDVVKYLYPKQHRDALFTRRQRIEELEAENAALKEKVELLERMVRLVEGLPAGKAGK